MSSQCPIELGQVAYLDFTPPRCRRHRARRADTAMNRWSNVGSISAADLFPHLKVTTAKGDESHLIDERELLLLAMRTKATDDNKIEAVQNEIVEIVRAWHRGQLVPRSEAPLLSKIYDRSFEGPTR
jgi:hypothetical protein